MITIYGIKNCDSVKKALNFFNSNSIDYIFIDFKTHPVDSQKIASWSKHVGSTLLLNTKGTTYRTLNLKSLDLDDNAKVEWMTRDNRLIKRPVIEYNANLIVGFNLSQLQGTFLS
jgi:Spx/MgsR family transcriptional regulator